MGRTTFIPCLAATVAALVALAVSGIAGATGLPASGDGITPVYRDGNTIYRDCEAATGEDHVMGFKLTRSSVSSYNGTYGQSSQGIDATHRPNNPMQVTIANAGVSGGAARLSWSANMPVDYVIVKAGQGATIYDYTGYGWGGHPATGPWGDTGLVSPKDSISHVLFCTIKKLRVEKTAVGTYDRSYDWTIEKQVKAEGGEFGANATVPLVEGESGKAVWKIAVTRTARSVNPSVGGAITVLNTSPFSASVTLTESLAGAAFGAGCPTFTLGRGASRTCQYSATLPAADAGLNTVEAKATNLSWMSTATASAPYAFAGAPANEINGTVFWDDSNGSSRSGITGDDAFEYEQQVACGTKGLREVETREIVNTVSLRGTQEQLLDEDSATLRVECSPATRQLLVAKTADLYWKRVTNWTVAKSASPTSHALMDGAAGSSTWSVDVTKAGVEDYTLVAGSITVRNPNAYEVTGVTIAESMPGASVECGLGDADKTPAAPVTIPAGATLNCVYTAEVDGHGAGINRVEVTTAIKGIGGVAEDAWEALETPNDGDVNATVTVVDERLARTWTASSSDDDRAFEERLPCANTTVVNNVVVQGDDPATDAVETTHALARASAQVTTTCGSTPTTPETPVVPETPVTPVVPAPPVSQASPAAAPVKAPPARPRPAKPAVKPVAKPVARPVVKPVAKPVVKPVRTVSKPVVKGKVVACVALSVSKKTVASGRRSTVTFVAVAAGKPVAAARISITGPGILKVVRTGVEGRVTTAIRPSTAGIVEATIAGRSCSSKRIGVVAPFEPPLTG